MVYLLSLAANRLATTVFAEKLDADPRDPLFFFSIPHVGTFSVVGIAFQFWFQMFALTLIHVVINVVAAFLAYKFILNKKQSATSLLVGFGVICPLLVYLPFCMIQAFDLRNPVLKLSAVSSPAIHIFRCFETMAGTLPEFATKSFRSFMWYFGATVEFNVDEQTKEVLVTSHHELRQRCRTLAVLFLQCVALYTLLVPVDFHLFPSRTITAVSDVFFWGNLCNNYMMGALTKTTVEFGMSTLAVLVSLCSGLGTVNINVYPLTASASPSDFWGKRWNTLVSSGLKRGIYRPCRKLGCSVPAAAFATFAASGLLHEYFLAATAFGGHRITTTTDYSNNSSSSSSYQVHLVGGHLLFFLWNAVVLILEGLLRDTTIIRWLEKGLPKPARTALVLMTVLPISHFFTDQFVSLGLYSGGFGLGYPQIRQVN